MRLHILHIIIILSFLLVRPVILTGQQDPLLSQYMFNTLAFNPAYAGTSGMLHAMITSRHQWLGFEDAPTTQTLTVHTPVSTKDFGIGLTYIHDKIGPVRTSSAWFDYSYHLRLNEEINLSLGLKGGFNHYKTDFSEFLADASPEEMNYLDAPEVTILPNFGLGAYLWTERLYLGLSAPRLLEGKLDDNTDPGAYISKERRIYILMAGYVYNINEELSLKPSFIARFTESIPASFDINAMLFFKSRFAVGAFYRPSGYIGGMAQIKLNNQLSIAYAYDISLNKLASEFGSSHELMIGYELSFRKDKVLNPRYF